MATQPKKGSDSMKNPADPSNQDQSKDLIKDKPKDGVSINPKRER